MYSHPPQETIPTYTLTFGHWNCYFCNFDKTFVTPFSSLKPTYKLSLNLTSFFILSCLNHFSSVLTVISVTMSCSTRSSSEPWPAYSGVFYNPNLPIPLQCQESQEQISSGSLNNQLLIESAIYLQCYPPKTYFLLVFFSFPQCTSQLFPPQKILPRTSYKIVCIFFPDINAL